MRQAYNNRNHEYTRSQVFLTLKKNNSIRKFKLDNEEHFLEFQLIFVSYPESQTLALRNLFKLVFPIHPLHEIVVAILGTT